VLFDAASSEDLRARIEAGLEQRFGFAIGTVLRAVDERRVIVGLVTREELLGLEQELRLSRAPATGGESVKEWLRANGHTLGRAYINDIDRHFGSGCDGAGPAAVTSGDLDHRPPAVPQSKAARSSRSQRS
jgi:hypothetical protein